MSSSMGHLGLQAVQDKEWETGVKYLTKALEDGNSPAWLLARSNALCMLKRHDEALLDAEHAYHAATERGSDKTRMDMTDAQYRRAVALYRLGRYADSDCCARWSMLLAEGRPASEKDSIESQIDADGNYIVDPKAGMDSTFPGSRLPQGLSASGYKSMASKSGSQRAWDRAYAWRTQILAKLDALPADHPGRKVSVTKVPPRPKKQEPTPSLLIKSPAPSKPPTTVAPGSVSDEMMKTRTDFYQTDKLVTITLFLKDFKEEDISVEFFQDHAYISPIPREAAPYVKEGDRQATSTLLFSKSIVPATSYWRVTPRKIELVVEKEVKGLKWANWGVEKIGRVEPDSTGYKEELDEPLKSKAGPDVSTESNGDKTSTVSSNAPRKGLVKNWEKLQLDDDDEDDKDMNGFFKKLFKNSTPEQRRAMMKSFTESNGTALSTDWNDVKDRTVETVPPEGVEPKKWTQ